MNDEVKRVFTPKPMVSFWSSRKISSYLVRAKLYPIERTVGSFGWGVNIVKSVNTSLKLITYKINHCLDCNEKCLVYLLTCNKYKEQYTGQTTDNFCGRWNNYKSKSKSFKRGVHASEKEHTEFLDDVSITLIDKTDGSNPTNRENYWMQTLKIFAPYSLNVEDSI